MSQSVSPIQQNPQTSSTSNQTNESTQKKVLNQAVQTLEQAIQSQTQPSSASTQNQSQTNQAQNSSSNKSKFASRKFILALVGVLTGILGIIGFNDNIVAVVAFVAIEILSIVAYCYIEGKIDAAAVGATASLLEVFKDLLDQLRGGEDVVIPDEHPTDDIVDAIPASDVPDENSKPIEIDIPDELPNGTELEPVNNDN